ncbi:Tautomerase/MIF superfamily [Trichoderma austrokoningii]
MDQSCPSPHRTPMVRITKPHDTVAPLSPTSERKKTKAKISSLETVIEGDARAQPSSSPDDAPRSVTKAAPRGEKERRVDKTQYFRDVFYERSERDSAAEVIRREALVYAEVKTNVTIEDEQHFLIDFSHQLAALYNRYPSSTVVSLLHSQCLSFGGSSHPAYVLTITALPSEVQSATNWHNTAALQRHMEAILCVPPSRGMVRFVPTTEECLGWGGITVTERISDAVAKEGEGSKSRERRLLKSLLLRKQEATGSAVDQPEGEEGVKVIKKKKSIIHTLFGTKAEEDS